MDAHAQISTIPFTHRSPSYVPAVADVLRVMQEHGVSQDEAVQQLGGQP